MKEVRQDIEAEKELVENTLNELTQSLQKHEHTYVELAGMAAFLHNIYNGIENILKKMVAAKGVSPDKQSPFWHQELLKTAIDNKIISTQLSSSLKDYLGFRHFFVHSYSLRLDAEKLMPLAQNVSNVWQAFLTEIMQVLDETDE